MLTGKPLFPGEEATQLEKVVAIFGKPTLEEWPDWTKLPNAHRIRDRPYPRRSVAELVPQLRPYPEALDLVERLLDYNPKTRLTAASALRHPFFDDLAGSPTTPTEQGAPASFVVVLGRQQHTLDGQQLGGSTVAFVITREATIITNAFDVAECRFWADGFESG
eukprot:GABV01003737.1.p1 GENE.GABV01003737.1~~GABV01003737.1.p1  ORF type:complete len:175 (+),score=63.42 GABV01003737.1:35-526(+)